MSPNKQNSLGRILLFFSIVHCNKLLTVGNKRENMWRTAGRLTGLLIQNCMPLSSDGPQEQFLLILQRCLKRGSLVVLDNSLKADVIRLGTAVELVRYRGENETQDAREVAFFRSTDMESDWKNEILQRIAHVLNTHVLKIRLNGYEELTSIISQEGRGRKKQQNMFMSLLLFGIAAVGLIMVPMGFQFLAVLGGKALLLAKMALILTAIQGLKKIATSNLNYGLYATNPDHHGPCKDDSCSVNYNSLEADDSVFVAFIAYMVATVLFCRAL
ncbi:hypothetical protein Zmor_000390 [Zophobas morio]|uniref:Uncharacterized protein n=1 Tax=Zophobas morio TaxID=2755281 RepID=A0AA38J165_9CUCU|nr:hypothetical protein Zmor_000390 [Zophobas morio]